MKGKDAHSVPRSPHRLRNYKKTILFGLLESLKSRFILTTNLTQRQFFRKFGKMKKKKKYIVCTSGRFEKQAYRSVHNFHHIRTGNLPG